MEFVMALKYTFDEFENAAKAAGLLENFSSADLKLAKANPNVGMGLLRYKQDYIGATTDEARRKANEGAEKLRREYGGYYGGSDGSGYYLESPSPSSFAYESAPERKDTYGPIVLDMLDKITSRDKFSYSPENDKLYSEYKKQYTREGSRAIEDTLGKASAASGGIPSSYAVNAAAGAGNYYAAKLADKIPELENIAYNRYVNDLNMDINKLSVVRDMQDAEYKAYLSELENYYKDKNFEYGKLMDTINFNSANDAAKAKAESEAFERKYTLAVLAAQNGDYSGLYELGITPNIESDDGKLTFDQRLTLAKLAAQYGDFTGLNALGITPNTESEESGLTFEQQLALAKLAGEYGDYLPLNKLGIFPVNTDDKVGAETIYEKIQRTFGNELDKYDIEMIKALFPGVTEEILLAAGFIIENPEDTK